MLFFNGNFVLGVLGENMFTEIATNTFPRFIFVWRIKTSVAMSTFAGNVYYSP